MRHLLITSVFLLGGCSSEDASVVEPGAEDSAMVDSTRDDTAQVEASDSQITNDANAEASTDSATEIDSAIVDSFSSDVSSDTNAADVADSTAPTDTGTPDAGARKVLLAQYCPSTVTAPGLYRGTLAANTNDITSACLLSAPGRDGALRVELEPGQAVRAVYRHAGDGVVYILDSCPVTSTCLAGANTSSSGEEVVQWKNTGSVKNPVYVVLDSSALGGAQTFELDLFVTGP